MVIMLLLRVEVSIVQKMLTLTPVTVLHIRRREPSVSGHIMKFRASLVNL
jgi:hypothetical protein